MKRTGHGNGLAIALAGLAVVIAASGTAYAVTTSVVNISDPTTPSHIAHVDRSGHLQTTGTLTTINSGGYLFSFGTGGEDLLISPTTASLALTRFRVSNPAGNANNFQVRLYKRGVDSGGNCATTASVLLGTYDIAPGQDTTDTFGGPFVVRPTAGAKYCVTVNVSLGAASVNHYVSDGLTAYVVSGTYTGLGSPSA